MPKISVILPVYNVEKYLERCIKSITEQSLQDIEIILATDGPDECDKICEKYAQKDERIKIIFHPKGYGKGFNEGLKIARGKYIAIVETDDWIDKTMFEKLFDEAEKTGADFVKCGFYKAFDDETKNFCELFDEYPNKVEMKENSKFFASQPSLWCGIYKTKFLIDNNIKMIEERMPFIDVHFHYLTCALAKNIQLIHKPLYFYYQDNPNQSVKSVSAKNMIKADKIAYEELSKRKIPEEYKEGVLYALLGHLYWCYKTLKHNDDKKAFWIDAKEFIETIDFQDVKFKYFTHQMFDFYKALKKGSYLAFDIKKALKTNIFSLKNTFDKKYKVLTILGIKIKLKRKNK